MYMETISWPAGKKCAAMVTVNLNAESFWLQIDPEAVNMPKTLSMGEYGMTRGLERILSIFDDCGIKATFFVPGKVAEEYPVHIRDVVSRGHDIACMGYSHENYGLLEASEQKKYLEKGADCIEKVCGTRPNGFRAPIGDLTADTLKIARDLGMKYSSNLSDDDRPYWHDLEGGEKLLEIPIHWSLYDLPYFALNYKPAFPKGQGRIANYTGVLHNWMDEFDSYYNYALCYVLQLDPQTIGVPGRFGLLRELLGYIAKFEGVWFCTGSEMHDYFISEAGA